MSIRNSLLRTYFARRMKAIDRFRRHPDQVQAEMFRQLIARGADTEFGRRHGVAKHLTPEAFAARVGVQDYESFKPYIERMLAGEKNVAAPGRVTLFARSSGTTSDRSKFIPVTRESVWWNHTLGMRDVAAVYASAKPQTKIFDGKTLTLGGSCSREGRNLVGDLSAVLIHETTFWSGWFRAPRTATAIIPDFDRKVEAICRECTGENITAFAGVPSWNLAMMRRVLEYTGKRNLLEVWPDLEMFAHGGVEFAPYRASFEELIPSERMKYMETYNASEGFFAMADDPSRSDMLLMLDYGTFFEFRSGTQIVPLEGVECGKVYAVLITSNNGLWRYEIGDTVQFTSRDPYKFIITGRTKYFINAFGEELIMDNAEKGLAYACEQTGAVVSEYTAAPVFMNDEGKCRHQWLIEFAKAPESIPAFAAALDKRLQEINSDYEAKRFHDVTLQQLEVVVARKGVFNEWLKRKGKLGGQHKVPRLSNNRKNIDELLELNGKEPGDAELRA